MESVQFRAASFKKSKRVKNPTKSSSTTTLKWPHPLDFGVTPETLAEAGFYYDPSYDDPDNVTCFICEKELAGWEEDDDPFLIHWTKCGQTCCWANTRCGLLSDLDRLGKFISSDKSRIPTHKSMEKARLETFSAGKGWIHDKTPNHGASSKIMARSGFVFTPQHSGDDMATCLYCNTSLSGWDDEDDPLEEHRKRQSKSDTTCPFFAFSDVASNTKPASRTQSTKPASKSLSKAPSRSTSRSKHQDVVMPTKTFDGEHDGDSDVESQTIAAQSTAKTPGKGRTRKSSAKPPKSKTRSSSRSGLKNVAEEDEGDEDDESVPPDPPVEKKSLARSKSMTRSEAVQHTESDDDENAARKPSRPRTKKAVSEPEEDLLRKSSRSKSKASVAPSVTRDEISRKSSRIKSKPKLVESEQEELVYITAKPKQKRTVSKSKAKAPVPVLEVETDSEQPEPDIATEAPKGKTSSKTKPPQTLASQDVSNDDIEATAEPEIVSVLSKRDVSSKSKPHPQDLFNDDVKADAELEIAKVAPKRKTSSKSKLPQTLAPQSLFDDDVVVGTYVHPLPPSPPPMSTHTSMTDLPPLLVPKRNTKTTSIQSGGGFFSFEKEKKKTERSSAKPQPGSHIEASDGESALADPERLPSPAYEPLVPVSINASVAKEISERMTKAAFRTPEVPKEMMKVVEISSDEDEPEPSKVDRPMNTAQQHTQTSCDSKALAVTQSSSQVDSSHSESQSKPTSMQGKRGKKLVVGTTQIEKPSATSPSPPPASLVVPDVSMDYAGPDEDVRMDEEPVTPSRPTVQLLFAPAVPDISPLEADPTSAEPLFTPALSKLPFAPLHALSEAELDMTVEEWIRYQMEVEYDKFRRDGEREIQRLRKRAEDVRKSIERL